MSACPFHASPASAATVSESRGEVDVETELAFLTEAHGGEVPAARREELGRALQAEIGRAHV